MSDKIEKTHSTTKTNRDLFKVRHNGKSKKKNGNGGSFKDELKKSIEKDKKKLAEEAISIMRRLNEVKPLYERLDKITMALTRANNLQAYGLAIIDNFKDKNTAFRAHGIRRFELKRIG